MSSMASACDHVDHVRTQLPYAALVGIVCILVGSLPAGFGISPIISLLAGAIILILALRFIGKKA